MRRNLYTKIITSIGIVFSIMSCTELDLVPRDAATSGNWFKTKDQFRQSLNEGYRDVFWPVDQHSRGWSDDIQFRDALNSIKGGTLTAEDGTIRSRWSEMYKGISRMLEVVTRLENEEGILSEADKKVFMAEANFLRASYWSYMISHWGDVPFYEKVLTVEEAFNQGRTAKETILEKVYAYYDAAALDLPVSYNQERYATKGAALAMKARIALYMGDFAIAAEAAQDVMDLEEYDLHPEYADLFYSSTKNSPETIFHIPRSEELNALTVGGQQGSIADHIPRSRGGWGAVNPSWELLAAYECTDGNPIDESPLFDPQNPFKNRDPRCNATIVPFGSVAEGDGLSPEDGSNFFGLEYNPHPQRLEIMNFETGTMVTNQDTRTNKSFASFNGLLFRKGINTDWWDDQRADNDRLIMRYADVLLMYAEAKIELDQIDQTVVDAINEVRTRAYVGSGVAAPLVSTAMTRDELRQKVRYERRVEFVREERRYMDLIRWKLAEKALSGFTYGMLSGSTLIDNVVTPGLWFWGMTPEIDEDGMADFDPLVSAGYARTLAEINFPSRQYLWPIPAEERLLVESLTQNDGY